VNDLLMDHILVQADHDDVLALTQLAASLRLSSRGAVEDFCASRN